MILQGTSLPAQHTSRRLPAIGPHSRVGGSRVGKAAADGTIPGSAGDRSILLVLHNCRTRAGRRRKVGRRSLLPKPSRLKRSTVQRWNQICSARFEMTPTGPGRHVRIISDRWQYIAKCDGRRVGALSALVLPGSGGGTGFAVFPPSTGRAMPHGRGIACAPKGAVRFRRPPTGWRRAGTSPDIPAAVAPASCQCFPAAQARRQCHPVPPEHYESPIP